MQIIVEAKSNFGVLDANTKKWMNPADKKLLSTFKLGKAYDVEMKANKGKDGKTYQNIVSVKEVVMESPAPYFEVQRTGAAVVPKGQVKTEDKGLSFPEKDSRILYQGVAQAVLQSQLVMKLDDVEPAVVKIVDMIKRLSGTK